MKVRERKASPAVDGQFVICGNGTYQVRFDLDAEWDALPLRTARFRFRRNGNLVQEDVPFTGDCCTMPVIRQSDLAEIGLIAGNIRTTTAARIPCLLCITDPDAHPVPDADDFYNAAMEMLRREISDA